MAVNKKGAKGRANGREWGRVATAMPLGGGVGVWAVVTTNPDAIANAHACARPMKRKLSTSVHTRREPVTNLEWAIYSIFRLVVSKGCQPRMGIALGSGKSQPLRTICFSARFVSLSRAIDKTGSSSYVAAPVFTCTSCIWYRGRVCLLGY